MRKILLLSVLSLVFSCSGQIRKADLLGTWYLYRHNNFVAIKFTKDSVFTNYELFSESGKWDLKNNILNFKDSKRNSVNQFEIRLDALKQSMTDLTKEAWLYGENLRKADDFSEYFKELKGIEHETTDNPNTSKLKWGRGFNVFLTNKTNYPKGSTDLSGGIEYLKQELERYKKDQPQEIQDRLPVLLFVDKGILGYFAEILDDLKRDISNAIYKVFETDIPDFQMEGIYWKAQLLEY